MSVAKWMAAAVLATVCAAGQTNQQPLGPNDPFAKKETQWVVAEPVAPNPVIAAGKTASVTIRFSVTKGNHVNSNKPTSELLIPTKLKLQPPSGLQVQKLAYPPGHDFAFSFAPDDKLNVYTGEFSVTAILRASPSAAGGPAHVNGELTYQACNDRSCFPPKHLPVSFDVTVQK